MRIAIMSDLHTEIQHYRYSLPNLPKRCHTLVLAGDIGFGAEGLLKAYDLYVKSGKALYLIYVPGNHDYYNQVFKEVDKQLSLVDRSLANVHVLKPFTRYSLGEWSFVGGTLWTDFEGYPNDPVTSMEFAANCLNDYRLIYSGQTESFTGQILRITPEFTKKMNEVHKAWIFSQLEMNRDKTIVVTHHAPTSKSIHPKWKEDPLTPAFANLWDKEVEEKGPAIWIHGHTHDPFDYTIGDTRVICNPRGYSNENPDWKIKYVDL